MFSPEIDDIVVIGDEKLFVTNHNQDEPCEITLENGDVYVIFEDEDEAGSYAKEYWEMEIDSNPEHLVDEVGLEQLVEWAYAGGGLSEWVDEWYNKPNEVFSQRGEEPVEAQYVGAVYKGEVVLYLQT